MKQIKTIADKSTDIFDRRVNKELNIGWRLEKRYYTPDYFFVAELEREEVTEEKDRRCRNCKHVNLHGFETPCCRCDVYSRWEPLT